MHLSIFPALKAGVKTSQVVPVIKNPPDNVGDVGWIPGSGRSPGGGHNNPLQYFCLENPVDRGVGRPRSIGLQRVRHD